MSMGNEAVSELFIFNGASPTPEEEALGRPSSAEKKNLALHVDQCTARYMAVLARLRKQNQAVGRIELLLYTLGILVLATSSPGISALKAVASAFGV